MIAKPQPIAGRTWHALNPDIAERRAVWGLRGPHGSTFLIHESGALTAVGLWSGRWPESAANVAREIESLAANHPGMSGIDRRISPADFKRWKA